jgi:hypothetical protein
VSSEKNGQQMRKRPNANDIHEKKIKFHNKEKQNKKSVDTYLDRREIDN